MHRYTLFREHNLVVIEYGSYLDDRGLRDHLLRVYDDPMYLPGMDEISSFLHTRRVHVTGEGLRALAKMFPRPGHENAAPNYVAVLTNTRLGMGLTRLYGAHAEVGQSDALQVFESVDEAAGWLDTKRGHPEGTTIELARRALTAPVQT